MKHYVATVEVEYDTESDPLETLQLIMNRVGWKRVKDSHWERLKGEGPYADHYHILQQPREIP